MPEEGIVEARQATVQAVTNGLDGSEGLAKRLVPGVVLAQYFCGYLGVQRLPYASDRKLAGVLTPTMNQWGFDTTSRLEEEDNNMDTLLRAFIHAEFALARDVRAAEYTLQDALVGPGIDEV